MKEKLVLSVLVDNVSGVLQRVASLFSRRGYNISSLTVSETENPLFSRMTIELYTEPENFRQIKRQLIKLEIVKKHLEDGVTLKELSEQYGIHTSNIKFYIALYRKHGESVFTNESRNKVYTREFKLQAIKRYMNGNESMRTIAVDLGFTDPGMVRDWVNKYKAGGEDAIQASTRRKNYLLHEERQDKIASDELKERIKYLEAENEYLKKSYSLILERNRQSKKK